MRLTMRGRRYVFECDFSDREVPKDAGFAWQPAAREWSTDKAEVARHLAEYADDAARQALEAAEAGAGPVLLPEGKPEGGHVADLSIVTDAGSVGIEVHYAVKDETLREELKAIGFRWGNRRSWERWLAPRCGDPVDVLAETAATLLEAGFRVRVHHAEARRRCVEGDYKEEPRRWIGFGEHEKSRAPLFKLTWARSDDLNEAAMSLPGARYGGSGAVIVPRDSHEAVADFAQLYGLGMLPSAKIAVEEQRAAVINAIVVKRKPRSAKVDAPTPGARPRRIAAVEGGVDAALLDD